MNEASAADPRIGWPVSYANSVDYHSGSGIGGTITTSRTKIGGTGNLLTAGGMLLDSTRVNGRLYINSLDLGARRLTRSSPEGRTGSAQFNVRGQPTLAQGWSRLPMSLSYDSLGQATVIAEGGHVDSIQWNALGFPTRVRRPDGVAVTFDRDTLGRVLRQGIADTLAETFTYDAHGNITRANLLGGRQYGFEYSAHDLLLADSLVSGGIELARYTYDGAQHLRSVSRPGRRKLTFQYDPAGRITTAGSTTAWGRVTYDPTNSRPAAITSSSGQAYTIEYDGIMPRIIHASGLATGEVEYLYSNDLRVRIVRINDQSVDYAFDGDGLITRGGQLNLTRDVTTGAVTRDSIGVVSTTRQYDDHGTLRRTELRISGVAVSSQAFVRDSIRRITAVVDSSAAGAFTMSYRYDALDRLERVQRDGATVRQFTYDAAGNRVTIVSGTGVVSATFASDDRILSFDGNAITHDSSGARVTEQLGADSLAYSYDDLGRLTSVASPAKGVLSFRHDAAGRRVQELRNGAVVRQFVYGMGAAPIGELDAGGSLRSEFVYVSGDIAPDYIKQGTKTIYLEHDQLGGIRRAIDVATGAVLQEIEYDATGSETKNTNPNLQPFAYAGGITDLDGRLVHFGARDYDARTGRWLQADPIGAAGGGNRYVYANNDPTNNYDPSGLSSCPNRKDGSGAPSHSPLWNTDSQGLQPPGLIDPVALLAGGLAGPIAGAFTGEAAATMASGAESAVNAMKLGKSLASAAQMGEEGTVIAGGSSGTIFRNAADVAKQYGGDAANWVKMTSSQYIAKDGALFETHWVQNVVTGVRVLIKTKIR